MELWSSQAPISIKFVDYCGLWEEKNSILDGFDHVGSVITDGVQSRTESNHGFDRGLEFETQFLVCIYVALN